MIHDGWAIVCVIGFWGWVLAGMGFILKVFPSRNAFKGNSAALWGGGFVFLYALWVLGMINA